MLVMLWGLHNDSPTAAVRAELEALGVPTVFVDQRRVSDIDVRMTTGETLDASLWIDGRWIELSEITSAYLRPFSSCELPAIAKAGVESRVWQHAAMVDDILLAWADLTAARLVNPLSAMSANGSKPYQLEQLRQVGWQVPETLITTDPQAAREFWADHGEVIYKSISGIRSKVSRLRPEHLERFQNITSCPTQLQRYIRGTDHRVHVIGSDVFACEVVSEADDYRYPGENTVELRPSALPYEIQTLCLKTADALGLPFVGIDLRLTSEDEWFCFEANPSPGFTYYESATGLPIRRAVARFLSEI
jgi:RimK-like ATP-grasp domain